MRRLGVREQGQGLCAGSVFPILPDLYLNEKVRNWGWGQSSSISNLYFKIQ